MKSSIGPCRRIKIPTPSCIQTMYVFQRFRLEKGMSVTNLQKGNGPIMRPQEQLGPVQASSSITWSKRGNARAQVHKIVSRREIYRRINVPRYPAASGRRVRNPQCPFVRWRPSHDSPNQRRRTTDAIPARPVWLRVSLRPLRPRLSGFPACAVRNAIGWLAPRERSPSG